MSNTTLTIIIIIWLLTPLRSILIMFGGSKLFKKALKGEKTAYIPILNLFTMLEIVNLSTFLGILLFIPVVNLVILVLMSIKLGSVFDVSTEYKIGLVLLPVVFYPLLFKSDAKYKYSDENYFLALDSARSDSINLMTQDEIKDLSNTPFETTEKVDSIFKTKSEENETSDVYRAAKIDEDTLKKINEMSMENNQINQNQSSEIKRIDPNDPMYQNTIPKEEENKKKPKFVTELDKEEKIEFIDL